MRYTLGKDEKLKSKILKTASIYEKQNIDKNFKPYVSSDARN